MRVSRRRQKVKWGRAGIYALRRHLGLTQQDMADELGVRQQTISDWETGMYRPRGASSRLLAIVAERADFDYEANTKKVEVERKVNRTTLRLCRGNITELEADAIVNAANNRLWMGGGVAGAIKRKGGKEIEEEAVRKGPIPIGEAVVTGAGRLRAKHVIHAATMGQDLATDERKVADATRNSLLRARELRLTSIAFPALGAGVGHLPLPQVARIMMAEVKGHIGEGTTLATVVFALYDEAAYRAFEAEL